MNRKAEEKRLLYSFLRFAEQEYNGEACEESVEEFLERGLRMVPISSKEAAYQSCKEDPPEIYILYDDGTEAVVEDDSALIDAMAKGYQLGIERT